MLVAGILFAVFLLLSRTAYINSIPVAMAPDELIYALNAQVLSMTGTDLTGTWNPLSLTPFNLAFAELPAVIMAPAFWLIDNPIVAGRATHVLLSLVLPFVFGWFVSGLFGNKKLFWFGVVMAAINPWFWQFGRMSFDSYPALFLFLLGTAVWWHYKPWKQLTAVPIFLLAFFMYQGYKVVFVPWLGILAITSIWQTYLSKKRPALKQFLKIPAVLSAGILLLFGAVVLAWYALVALPDQSAKVRLNTLVLLDSELQATQVEAQRRLTIDNPLESVFSNKGTFIWHHVLERYARSTEPQLLFVTPEWHTNAFSVPHGFFYLIDGLALIAGGYLLLKNKRYHQVGVLLVGLTVVAQLAAVLHSSGHSYTFRSGLAYALLLAVVVLGVSHLWHKNHWWRVGLVVGYTLSVAVFSYHYFYSYPLVSTEGLYYQNRLLSEYVSRLPAGTKVSIHSEQSEGLLGSYLFYSDVVQADIHDKIIEQDGSYQFEDITFTNDCVNPSDSETVYVQDRLIKLCEDVQEATVSASVVMVKDSGALFHLYNDQVCAPYELERFVQPNSLIDFDFPKMTDAEFCKTWLVKQ